ncbi:MAG: cobalamin-binding protein [Gemmatimonadales bacterium]|nr:MAG: cobalamin-binding protein [Gemmatimonadales bacterium]
MGSTPQRIASLLPAATEIVAALGARDRLVLRSHECDVPEGVQALPHATEPRWGPDGTSYGIDEQVKAVVQEALSVYRVDSEVLAEADPDLVITQEQCRVCAVSTDELAAAVAGILDPAPRILSLSPGDLDAVFADMARVAEALGDPEAGRVLVAGLRGRLDDLREAVEGRARPRLLAIEWLDPLMVSGNWIPELVHAAGGENLLAEPGAHSPFVEWPDLRATDPDVIVVMPCGFTVERTLEERHLLEDLPGWNEMRAVKAGRVAVADGHHFFNRPGPRVVESAEILAEVLHPGVVDRGHRERRAWVPLGAATKRRAG